MTTCSRMIKVICKLSTSNAFQFGTFFFQFAVVTAAMMMDVVHFPNVVTEGQMTGRPSISRFSQL